MLILLGPPLWQATGWRQAACQDSKDVDTQLQQPDRSNPQLWAQSKTIQYAPICTKQPLPGKLDGRGSEITFLR